MKKLLSTCYQVLFLLLFCLCDKTPFESSYELDKDLFGKWVSSTITYEFKDNGEYSKNNTENGEWYSFYGQIFFSCEKDYSCYYEVSGNRCLMSFFDINNTGDNWKEYNFTRE